MIQTMRVVTLMVLLGKPLQYVALLVQVTAVFKNTLKLKSRLLNYVFRCRLIIIIVITSNEP